ncbi:lectin [Rhodanobacter glycinis]|uniref:lectin n=1 Tax=Rhodanobacter glycinis TaxID=582702 RepID=UPI001FDED5B5|nr:lectin [Rhodanobacter glycinis]
MLAGHREAFRCGQPVVKRRWSGIPFGIACTLVLVGCGGTDQPATAPASAAASTIKPVSAAATDTLAHYDGYGDMRFGMDEAAFDRASFNKAWAGELKGAPGPESTCFYKTPKWVKSPREFAFMFEGGRFVRYDVGTAKEVAPGGGRVGMDEARIRTLYGARVEAQPHKYVAGAKYLRVAAPQSDGVVVFETDAQGKVTRWHAGVPPQVDYVENCG